MATQSEHSGQHIPKTPKLEIPFFNGENVLAWIFQIDRFFAYHRTPESQKLEIASFYMSGDALVWHQWMSKTD